MIISKWRRFLPRDCLQVKQRKINIFSTKIEKKNKTKAHKISKNYFNSKDTATAKKLKKKQKELSQMFYIWSGDNNIWTHWRTHFTIFGQFSKFFFCVWCRFCVRASFLVNEKKAIIYARKERRLAANQRQLREKKKQIQKAK